MRGRRTAALALLGLVGALSFVCSPSCSTAGTPLFSDGACVAGGCASTNATSSSSSGVACTVDTACSVSWATDVFAAIVDGPAGCTGMSCHGAGAGGVTLTTGDAAGAYTALTTYTLLSAPGPAKRYIVPCSTTDSGFPCNMVLGASDGANTYGTCGTGMPLVTGSQTPLTTAQLTTIADWITCGAPDN